MSEAQTEIPEIDEKKRELMEHALGLNISKITKAERKKMEKLFGKGSKKIPNSVDQTAAANLYKSAVETGAGLYPFVEKYDQPADRKIKNAGGADADFDPLLVDPKSKEGAVLLWLLKRHPALSNANYSGFFEQFSQDHANNISALKSMRELYEKIYGDHEYLHIGKDGPPMARKGNIGNIRGQIAGYLKILKTLSKPDSRKFCLDEIKSLQASLGALEKKKGELKGHLGKMNALASKLTLTGGGWTAINIDAVSEDLQFDSIKVACGSANAAIHPSKNDPLEQWLADDSAKGTLEKYSAQLRAVGVGKPPRAIIVLDELLKSGDFSTVGALGTDEEKKAFANAMRNYLVSEQGGKQVTFGKNLEAQRTDESGGGGGSPPEGSSGGRDVPGERGESGGNIFTRDYVGKIGSWFRRDPNKSWTRRITNGVIGTALLYPKGLKALYWDLPKAVFTGGGAFAKRNGPVMAGVGLFGLAAATATTMNPLIGLAAGAAAGYVGKKAYDILGGSSGGGGGSARGRP